MFICKGASMKTYIRCDSNFTLLYAIKFENKKHKKSYCEIESIALREMNQIEGFPKIFENGYIKGKGYVVETLIGPNLKNIISFLKRGFDIYTIAKIGIQLPNILEKLHKKGIIHCDIKPSDIGFSEFHKNNIIKDNQIYVLDFGSCRRFLYRHYKKDKEGIINDI